MDEHEAKINVLTAEVRTLVVGKRQVTLSVYRQLDSVPPHQIEPFGRVRDQPLYNQVQVVGRSSISGALVRANIHQTSEEQATRRMEETGNSRYLDWPAIYETWSALHLIVLAGLR